jgi:hypothetical protein
VHVIGAAALVLAAGLATWRMAPGAASGPAAAVAAPMPGVGSEVRPAGPAARGTDPAPVVAAMPAAAPATAASTPPVLSAAETMADARIHGERRAPPIDPPAPAAPRAEPWEVADPAAYRAREQRLAREVDARFVAAAQARLGDQRAALQELQARGASPEDLARAEDKIRHLAAAQAALIASGAAPSP